MVRCRCRAVRILVAGSVKRAHDTRPQQIAARDVRRRTRVNLALSGRKNVARIVSVDIGCQPSPSGSNELILQSEGSTVVVFTAIDTKLSARGYLEDKGTALVRCQGCNQTRQGYPNDEGRLEHPLWSVGLSEALGVAEVEDSDWVAEVENQQAQARNRLWTESAKATVTDAARLRHFIFKFKESTFECLASNLSVSLHRERYSDTAKQALALVLNETAT